MQRQKSSLKNGKRLQASIRVGISVALSACMMLVCEKWKPNFDPSICNEEKFWLSEFASEFESHLSPKHPNLSDAQSNWQK